jgi:acyl carrier protein
MTEQDIEQKLRKIIKIYLPADSKVTQINKDDHLMQDLGINSSHLVDVALDVEDEFDITLDEQDMERMQTVGAALQIVQAKIS